ncbi:hypothetical protein ACXJJ3_23305 [Kribbella sp. WER1]
MKRWLWWVNGVAMPVTAAAAIIQPVKVNSAPCGSEVCDPHGYILIFTSLPAAGVVLLALVALIVLASGNRAGFGVALAAAVCCGGLLVLTGAGLSGQLLWSIVGLSLVAAGLATAGLRLVPNPPPLVEPPYPPVGP